MSDIFKGGHGCVAKVQSGNGSSVSIPGWSVGSVGSGLVTVDDMTITAKEVVGPVVAADNVRILYSFGQNFGEVSIVGTAYLGPASTTSDMFSQLQANFDNNLSVYNTSSPITASLAGGLSCKAYFTELILHQVDATKQSIRYQLQGLVAPTPNGSK